LRATVFGAAVRFVLLPLLAAAPLAAADGGSLSFEFVPEEERWTIFVDGPIDDGAAARFREELASRQVESAAVVLNSPGGLLFEGMAFGQLIRQHGFATHVGRKAASPHAAPAPGACLSACVFAFLGGLYRFAQPASSIGVHRFSALAETDVDSVQVVSASVVKYIGAMGADVELFERMSRKGREQILVLSAADLKALRVVNNGRMPARWSVHVKDGAMQVRGAQQSWDGAGEIVFSCSDGRVAFQPSYQAGARADELAIQAIGHAMRVGGRLVALGEPLQPLDSRDGRVSALFALDRDQAESAAEASSVGYAIIGSRQNLPSGFTVDMAEGREALRSLAGGCRP
jgi:hypothetical protein